MKKKRLIGILAAIAVTALAATALVPVFGVLAEDKTYTAGSLFSESSVVDASGASLKVNAPADEEFTFKKTVQTKDFSMKLSALEAGMGKLTVTFKQKDSYGEDLENSVVLDLEAGKVYVDEADKQDATLTGEVVFEYKGDALTAAGKQFAMDEAGKNEATVAFRAEKAGSFVIGEINGQSLALTDGSVKDGQAPYIAANDDSLALFETEDEAADAANEGKKVLVGVRYQPDYTAYDVLSGSLTNTVAFKKVGADEEWQEKTSAVYLAGGAGTEYLVRITSKDDSGLDAATRYAKIALVNSQNAPAYLDSADNAEAYAAYEAKVEEAARGEGEEGDESYHSIAIGSGQYYKIPSLKDLIECDTAYEDLSFTVYYSTPSATDRTTSNLTIEVTAPGTYTFRVVPKDTKGRRPLKENCPEFSFTVYDTEKPVVTAGTTQNKGYKGLSFTSSSFTIKGYNTSAEYSLEYRASENDEWAAAEEELSTLTFTPEKLGYYRIKCEVTGGNQLKADPVYSKEISVGDPVIVKDGANWAKNNVLSIVFLSIAGASLIGIIVLLLIRPKDAEETPKKK